jgi:hypothetical protein
MQLAEMVFAFRKFIVEGGAKPSVTELAGVLAAGYSAQTGEYLIPSPPNSARIFWKESPAAGNYPYRALGQEPFGQKAEQC